MVLYAIISRLSDGLPLSATTDHEPNRSVLESKKFAKMLSKRASQYPDRCSLFTGSHWLHFISAIGVCFTTMCEENYPSVLAFCFLKELQNEFITTYDGKRVANALRPYALIEFDTFIQKTKTRFNNTRTLSSKINLTEMTMEVKLRPPFQLTLDDLGFNNPHNSYGYSSGQVQNSTDTSYKPNQGHAKQLMKLEWTGMLCILLSLFCMVINFARLISLVNYLPTMIDDDPKIMTPYIMAFGLATVVNIYQISLLIWFVRWRGLKNIISFNILLVCNIYLFMHHMRDLWMIVFHILVTVCCTYEIYHRRLKVKLSDYTV
ncbi:vesicle-trafficking protein SEC22a-like [Anneissia japonica]|uniref:vesicle-trafficking protein SEC22a-like n=1 Tax=Anneissia japonica TaxID=1529436 RepID=UPI001425A4DA|nr:vesicle-trafficking protein SEC22a-like [Anneissia japonica]